MRNNIFAFTDFGGAPPFLSINRTEAGLEITVRNPAKESGDCGETATITLSEKQELELMIAFDKEWARKQPHSTA
jgi:hypothetical protein